VENISAEPAAAPRTRVSPSARIGRAHEAAALADLVNQAFSIETTFVDGHRTSPEEIARMMTTGAFLVIDWCFASPFGDAARSGEAVPCRDGAHIGAAVYVEDRGDGAYFGMLSVRPELQGMGLGKRLVCVAEALGSARGASHMAIRIVNVREELSRWYKSLGYREVGVSPYEHRPVKRPVHFVEMKKRLPA
jgi:GNAT superfamily N-acetyltransferase